MNNVKIKRSNVPGKTPTTTDVGAGELAVNTNDSRMFYGIGSDVIELANKSDLDTVLAAITSVSLGVVQARRTTTYTTTTTATDITFDVVDVIGDPNVCSRDAINTQRFVSGQSGKYLIIAEIESIASNSGSVLTAQLKLNGTTVLPKVLVHRPASTSARTSVTLTGVVDMVANDYVTLQLQHTSNSLVIQANTLMTMIKLDGLKGDAGAMGGDQSFYFPASSLDFPNTSNWAVNAPAPTITDSVNNSLLVRAFDDTVEEGTGLTIYVPPSASNITFSICGRASTAPSTAKTVAFKLYSRLIGVDAAVGAWSAAHSITGNTIPPDVLFHNYVHTIPLATLGITAGSHRQLELTRDPSDTLSGDWLLFNLTVSFS
jgi:hypothetical protein